MRYIKTWQDFTEWIVHLATHRKWTDGCEWCWIRRCLNGYPGHGMGR